MTAPTTVADILALLLAEPGRPRLTWYGPGGERIELSGAVLGNWVAKTTNLLVEEFDAGAGTGVGVDLPAHWRTAVWALAAWRCGAGVALGSPAHAADVVVTHRPADHAGAPGLVAVALPALARAFDGDLPPGAVDAAGAVMTYGDVVGWAPPTDPTAVALRTDDDVVRHADLVRWALDGAPAPAGSRVLVEVADDGPDGALGLLRTAVAAWSTDGSVVVLAPAVVAELADDAPRRERLLAGERVTAG